jgi:hypothetical protein
MSVIFLYLLLHVLGHTTSATTVKLSITYLWNSLPITDLRPVQLTLPSTSPPGLYPGLWNYQVVVIFFFKSNNKSLY